MRVHRKTKHNIQKRGGGVLTVILENLSICSLEKYHKQPLAKQGNPCCIPEPRKGLITQRDAMMNQQAVLKYLSGHRPVLTRQTTHLHLAGTFYSLHIRSLIRTRFLKARWINSDVVVSCQNMVTKHLPLKKGGQLCKILLFTKEINSIHWIYIKCRGKGRDKCTGLKYTNCIHSLNICQTQ